MDYFFRLVQDDNQSQDPHPTAEDLENDTDEPELFSTGIAIPLTTVVITPSYNIIINGNLNGQPPIDINSLDEETTRLFSVNIYPGDRELIEKLVDTLKMYRKTKLTNMTKNEPIECCICFNMKDYKVVLPCKHEFCLECIGQVVFDTNNNKCPLCRDVFIN